MRHDPHLNEGPLCRMCGGPDTRAPQLHGQGLCDGCYRKEEARLTVEAIHRATKRLKELENG